MKQRIFMYLFVFSVLLIVFQYVNSKNIFNKYEKDITTLKVKNTEKDSLISNLEDRNIELNYFNLENNEEALTYFEDKGYDIEILIPQIIDGLYAMNNYEGEDHPIVPYVSMTESKMIINKVKLLNHKWVLANFTDGKHWGELFITYELDDNSNLKYQLKDYFLYPIGR